MTSVQKILFTIVFTVYGLIFYVLFYHLIAWYDSTLLSVPETLDADYLGGAAGLFLLIVVLAYLGASYIVLGELREPTTDREFRRRRDYDRPPPPEPAPERSFARQAGVQRTGGERGAPRKKTSRRRGPATPPDDQHRRRGRPPS